MGECNCQWLDATRSPAHRLQETELFLQQVLDGKLVVARQHMELAEVVASRMQQEGAAAGPGSCAGGTGGSASEQP